MNIQGLGDKFQLPAIFASFSLFVQLQAGANKHFCMKVVVLSTFTKLTKKKRHFSRQEQQVTVFWEASSEDVGKAW